MFTNPDIIAPSNSTWFHDTLLYVCIDGKYLYTLRNLIIQSSENKLVFAIAIYFLALNPKSETFYNQNEVNIKQHQRKFNSIDQYSLPLSSIESKKKGHFLTVAYIQQ